MEPPDSGVVRSDEVPADVPHISPLARKNSFRIKCASSEQNQKDWLSLTHLWLLSVIGPLSGGNVIL